MQDYFFVAINLTHFNHIIVSNIIAIAKRGCCKFMILRLSGVAEPTRR